MRGLGTLPPPPLLKRYAEAEEVLLRTERELVAARGEGAPVIADARQRIVDLYTAWNRPQQAEEWRAKLAPPAGAN